MDDYRSAHSRHGNENSAAMGLFIAIALCVFMPSQTAGAHEFSPLLYANQYAEAARAAEARLAADPANADAWLTQIDILLHRRPENGLEQARKLAERCVAEHPQRSECFVRLGKVMGAQAQMASPFVALAMTGKIRSAFEQALVLDSKDMDARFALLQYYLRAPAIVGGGVGKARAFVNETAKIEAGAAGLMQAFVDLHDKNYYQAEHRAFAPLPAMTPLLLDKQWQVQSSVARAYMDERRYDDAERSFRLLQRQFPDKEAGYSGAGLVAQARLQYRDAIALFEAALAVEPTAITYFHLGQCRQAMHDNAEAAEAFEQALSLWPPLSPEEQADAKRRIKLLKN